MNLWGDEASMGVNIWMPFRNDAEDEIPAFGVCRIDGSTTINGQQHLKLKRPNTYGSQYSHRVNGPTPVAVGAYGMCTILGDVAALYDTSDGTPAVGEFWGPRSGGYKLKKNTGGFIVTGETDSTYGIVLVTRFPFLRFTGQADDTMTVNSTGTVSILYRSGLTTYADTTANVTVFNVLDGTVTAGSGVECAYEPYGTTEGWRVVQADCP